MSDLTRFSSLIDEGYKEDAIRTAILDGVVKPIYPVNELNDRFQKWSEDGTFTYNPLDDLEDGVDDNLFVGNVILEVNRITGLLDCDFQNFTKQSDIDAGANSIPRYALTDFVTLREVMDKGGLTARDVAMLCHTDTAAMVLQCGDHPGEAVAQAQTAKPEDAPPSTSPSNPVIDWAEVQAYRDVHTIQETANHFGISVTWVKKNTKGNKRKKKTPMKPFGSIVHTLM